MKRREFLTILGRLAVVLAGSLVLAPVAAEAQPPDRVRRLGLLLPYVQTDPQAQARVNAFRAALQERGWTDGRNIRLEFRYSEGQPNRLPALAADLVQQNVDVLLTASSRLGAEAAIA
jgi:ABC-type sugar transport system substrate-binding protein